MKSWNHRNKSYAIAKANNASTVAKEMLIILLTTLLLLVSVSVIACSCRPPGDLTFDEYMNADLIFIGKVTSVMVDKENYLKVATFDITDRIKADGTSTSIEIQTGFDGASCGYSFAEGETWYIWGRLLENGRHGTGLCSRSLNIPENIEGRNMERFDTEMAFIKDIKSRKGYQRFDVSEGRQEGKMKKGKRCGKWKFYDAAGTLVEECKYKKGVKQNCTTEK